jgi:outer membrane protein assembly factor BamB
VALRAVLICAACGAPDSSAPPQLAIEDAGTDVAVAPTPVAPGGRDAPARDAASVDARASMLDASTPSVDASADRAPDVGNPGASGLDRHDFLYCGEWQTDRPGEHIYLVRGGKVVWSHDIGDGDELGDCTMLSNGHIVFSRRNWGAREIVPDLRTGQDGEIVWDYKEPAGAEVHSAQPIGLERVLVAQNGAPAKVMLINKVTRAVDLTIMTGATGAVHGQHRHVRMTAKGTFLVPYMNDRKVVEFDRDGKTVIWQLDFTGADANAPDGRAAPWAAVRLRNGNTLVSGNDAGWVREYDPARKLVWELTRADLKFESVQEAFRLANGNTLVNNWAPNSNGSVQVAELTPDKKVVWKIQDWKMLPTASSTQLLDEPGTPESPGEQQR